MTAALLLGEALKLPVGEREKPCGKLQDSLSAGIDETLAPRLEAHQRYPEQVITREALEVKWQAKWDWKP